MFKPNNNLHIRQESCLQEVFLYMSFCWFLKQPTLAAARLWKVSGLSNTLDFASMAACNVRVQRVFTPFNSSPTQLSLLFPSNRPAIAPMVLQTRKPVRTSRKLTVDNTLVGQLGQIQLFSFPNTLDSTWSKHFIVYSFQTFCVWMCVRAYASLCVCVKQYKPSPVKDTWWMITQRIGWLSSSFHLSSLSEADSQRVRVRVREQQPLWNGLLIGKSQLLRAKAIFTTLCYAVLQIVDNT